MTAHTAAVFVIVRVRCVIVAREFHQVGSCFVVIESVIGSGLASVMVPSDRIG